MNSWKKTKKSKKKHDKKSKKDRKRKRHSSSDSSSQDTSLSSSSNSSIEKKQKHKKRKHKKDHKRKKARRNEDIKNDTGCSSKAQTTSLADEPDFSIPIDLMDNKQKAPETREEYEKRQSIVRRVVDEETGRSRLIKGDGEVIEEIVSKDRHREINRLATQTDGQVYQKKTIGYAEKQK